MTSRAWVWIVERAEAAIDIGDHEIYRPEFAFDNAYEAQAYAEMMNEKKGPWDVFRVRSITMYHEGMDE